MHLKQLRKLQQNYSARKVEYLVKSKNDNKFKDKTVDANILKSQERIEKIVGLKVNKNNKKKQNIPNPQTKANNSPINKKDISVMG